jgi:hypothetical protein
MRVMLTILLALLTVLPAPLLALCEESPAQCVEAAVCGELAVCPCCVEHCACLAEEAPAPPPEAPLPVSADEGRLCPALLPQEWAGVWPVEDASREKQPRVSTPPIILCCRQVPLYVRHRAFLK